MKKSKTKKNQSKVGRGKRFKNGLIQLAEEFGVVITTNEANEAWQSRSGVTHGVGLPIPRDPQNSNICDSQASAQSIRAYLLVETIVRKTIQKAICDDSFAARFESENAIETWLGE